MSNSRRIIHWEKNAIESIAFISKSMYIIDSNQHAIELVTYLLFLYTEKKDLIESKKIICLKHFLWCKEMFCFNETKFAWFKQNIFGPNKYLFESNKFLP